MSDYKYRCQYIRNLSCLFNRSDIYVLYTPDKECASGSINDDMVTIFRRILEKKSTFSTDAVLLIDSYGGSSDAAISIVGMLHSVYSKVIGIAYDKAYSAATIALLCCDEILMSRFARLGPIDPQVTGGFEKGPGKRPILSNINSIRKYYELLSKEHLEKINEVTLEYYCAAMSYSDNVLKPIFKKHCSVVLLEYAWCLFNGGFGSHSHGIDFVSAKELGLDVKKLPSEIESEVKNIIRSMEDEAECLSAGYYSTAIGKNEKEGEITAIFSFIETEETNYSLLWEQYVFLNEKGEIQSRTLSKKWVEKNKI